MSDIEKLINKINGESSEEKLVTESDIIEVINKVASTHRNKKFGYFDTDDIMQEVWVICMKQISQYEPEKGRGPEALNSLERWLNTVVRNRLINLHRDKCNSTNVNKQTIKSNLINCLPIDGININNENHAKESEEPIDGIIGDELFGFIEQELGKNEDDSLIHIFYDHIAGENISPYYKTKLMTYLKEIIYTWSEMHHGC